MNYSCDFEQKWPNRSAIEGRGLAKRHPKVEAFKTHTKSGQKLGQIRPKSGRKSGKYPDNPDHRTPKDLRGRFQGKTPANAGDSLDVSFDLEQAHKAYISAD